jgi:hypothetical protein
LSVLCVFFVRFGHSLVLVMFTKIYGGSFFWKSYNWKPLFADGHAWTYMLFILAAFIVWFNWNFLQKIRT